MSDDTVRIELRRSKGKPSLWAVVDAADYELVSQYKWVAAKNGRTFYVISKCGNKTIYMHRLILGASKGSEVDHVDHDGLNNCRANLRIATRRENVQNRRGVDMYAGRPTTSRFKGVSWHGQLKTWTARITVAGRHEYLGLFATQEEAARAYDRRARAAYGEFAMPNFPDEPAA